MTPKPSSASLTEMNEYVLPQHANALGNVFGGQIMSWVDLCGAICGQRHSGQFAVTVFVDDLKFEAPIKIGEVAHLRARITATFRTSMEIEVIVEGEDARTGRRWRCVSSLITFVAIDQNGKPTPVPPLALDTPEAKALQAAGEKRREERLRRG